MKEITAKTFIDYRRYWCKSRFNMTFKQYINKYQLKPFSWKKKTKYSSLGPFPVDLDKYIKNLIQKSEHFDKQYKFRDISNERYGGTCNKKNIEKIYKKRNLYRWYSIIYKITQKIDAKGNKINDGKILIGFTTRTLNSRWYFYKQNAIKNNKTGNIFRLIRKLDNAGINIDDAFKFEVIEICWNDIKTRIKEDEWINYFKAKYPNRIMNVVKGGGGGPKINVPKSILIPYIAKGMYQSEMIRTIKREHNIILSRWALYERIEGYWPKKKNMSSLKVAREEILKPILKDLIKHGYSTIFLSGIVFKRGRDTIRKWCDEFWQKTYDEIKRELLKKNLRDLISRGLEYREIDENVRGIPWSTINELYYSMVGKFKKSKIINTKTKIIFFISKQKIFI